MFRRITIVWIVAMTAFVGIVFAYASVRAQGNAPFGDAPFGDAPRGAPPESDKHIGPSTDPTTTSEKKLRKSTKPKKTKEHNRKRSSKGSTQPRSGEGSTGGESGGGGR